MLSSGPNRKFCLLFAAACAVLGIIAHRAGYQKREIVWESFAAFFFVVALVAPRIAAPARRAWMALGHRLSSVVNPVVLGIVFVGVLVPIGLIRRLVGHDAAVRGRYDPAAASYWIPRSGLDGPDNLKEPF
jgi:hypothetical protein